MSTKIYNGFILNSINTLEDAFIFAKELKPKLKSMADLYWLKMMVEISIAHLDTDLINNNVTLKSNISYWMDAYKRIIEAETESIKTRTKSFTNVDVELALAPVQINKKKAIIGISFFGNRAMQEHFLKLPEVSEYAYYDNTDEPETISKADWEYRGKVWDSVFDDSNYIVGQSMFTIKLVPDDVRIITQDFIKENYATYIPTFEKRVESAAQELVLREAQDKGHIDKPSDYFGYINTTEYKDAIEDTSTRVRNILPKEIELRRLTHETSKKKESKNVNRTPDK